MADSTTSPLSTPLNHGPASQTALRAQSYIEERFRGPIRLDELCEFLGVGRRTLQRCFKSNFQTSPTRYIKTRRLQAARRALLEAHPTRDAVTPIAIANGFTHLGRFSVEYGAHFGESPSQTLARTPEIQESLTLAQP